MTTSTYAVPPTGRSGHQSTGSPAAYEAADQGIPAVTAAAFLFGRSVEQDADALARSLERVLAQSGALDDARSRLGAVGGSVWTAAQHELAAMATDFLALDLASVLVAGWRKCHELSEAAESTRGTAASVVVPLGSRHISLAQYPSIDLVLGASTVPAIRFELAVDVEVLAVAARVRDGRLVALEGGRCEVTVSFSAEGRCLAERKGELDPRISVPLGRGVPLPRAHRPADLLTHRPTGSPTVT